MANAYAEVRRRWKDIQTERDLKSIWRGERFESNDAIEDALRVYEMAIRVDGWPQVRSWAQECLQSGQILHAQQVELAMRCTEQKDEEFFCEITDYLQSHSPANYFRFWFALFTARHSHFGERLFRRQLGELRDYTIVKYRRWIRKVMRKLRFRCHSEKEKAIGAIVFGMYAEYDKKAYPSEVFEAYIDCHKKAANPKRTKSNKPVSKAQQVKTFSEAAAKLGIWSITEGIRTSARLPRTIGYLSTMAPCMSKTELLRSLRAFDVNLLTASHKKASQEVVDLASYIRQRLEEMEQPIEEWCKIYPYLKSPALVEVFQGLIEGQVDQAVSRMAQDVPCSPLLLLPGTMGGRHFRVAMVASYLLFLRDPRAVVYQLESYANRLLSHPTMLFPKGFMRAPVAADWRTSHEPAHQPLFQLISETFPDAANRQNAQPDEARYLQALRHRLYVRDLVDGGSSAMDIPLLFFAEEPTEDTRRALEAHLSLFAGAILILARRKWETPLALPRAIHLIGPSSVDELLTQLTTSLNDRLPGWREQFEKEKEHVDQELRFLRLQAPPPIQYISL